jgi:LysR family hydrogen peroxide-inducible transcriptional activator
MVLKQNEILKDLAGNMMNVVKGEICIGIIPTVASSLLPLILTDLLEQFPELKIHIRELTTEYIIEKLRQGEIDAGILATPLNMDDIEEEILYYEGLQIYGSNLELTENQYILPEEINNQKVWLLEEGNCLRNQLINLCEIKKNQQHPGGISFMMEAVLILS